MPSAGYMRLNADGEITACFTRHGGITHRLLEELVGVTPVAERARR